MMENPSQLYKNQKPIKIKTKMNKKFSNKFLAIALFTTTSATATISAQDTITITADQVLTIPDDKVNAGVPADCDSYGPIYRWWRNDSRLVSTEQVLTAAPNTLEPAVYKFQRITRCGDCGQAIISPKVYAKVKLSPVAELVASMVTVAGGSTKLPTFDASDISGGGTSVTISGFQIGKYEVTQCQWVAVMGSLTQSQDAGAGDNYPVYYVSWNDIVGTNADGATVAYTEKGVSYYTNGFCAKLSALVGGGKHFRLPTDAEWEYAAKGGVDGDTSPLLYSGSANIDDVAWYGSNAGGTIHEVGGLTANVLGIHDMSGNVYEWCGDWYSDIYPNPASDDPTGPSSSVNGGRVFRGGFFADAAVACDVSYRVAYTPSMREYIGFRVAVSL
jgi:formylglycine-generating enzyme required for sulfatase activity